MYWTARSEDDLLHTPWVQAPSLRILPLLFDYGLNLLSFRISAGIGVFSATAANWRARSAYRPFAVRIGQKSRLWARRRASRCTHPGSDVLPVRIRGAATPLAWRNA